MSDLSATETFKAHIYQNVAFALQEDIGTGDITAALIDPDLVSEAHLFVKESAVFCGKAWAIETFHQVNSSIELDWFVEDGDFLEAGTKILKCSGSVASILTAERTVINFLQTLSGTATTANFYRKKYSDINSVLLDTRKTIPGLRFAQKYAVRCGGLVNHRMGLYDQYLIKENHIVASGGIQAAIRAARALSSHAIEIEVSSLSEFLEAYQEKPDSIMLDNFNVDMIEQALSMKGQFDYSIPIEISGNIEDEVLNAFTSFSVDFISIGALTKHLHAIDFSLLLDSSE